LRDRWLERVQAPGGASVLASSGKYDVSRSLEAAQADPAAIGVIHAAPVLPAASSSIAA
jgi:hypothetical protein